MEEALRSTKEKDNFQRLIRLLMCGGVRLLREKFDSFHSPADLPLKLSDPATEAQLKKAKTSKPEWACLYPSPGTFGKSTDFDITLTFRLLRTICNLTPPPLTGSWDDPPDSADHSLEADLVRIKYYRNSVYGHNQEMEIRDYEFCNLWKEIRDALLRIAGTISQAKRDEWKKSIDELLGDPLTTEVQRYVDELQVWYKNDMEVKDVLEQLRDQLQQVSMAVQQINIIVRNPQQVNEARAQSQQKASEEIVKRTKELRDEREQDRQEALREVQELTRMEDDKQRRNLDRQRHEREEKQRKREEEEKLLRLKGDLMNYDFHRCPRIKKESFKDLEVDDIDLVRIVLIGPAGSGKTSYVGTLQRAIGEQQSAFGQGTGKEGTIHLEEYYIQKKIRMVDTRGFFESDERLMDECLKIMSGRIRPGEIIVRNYDKEGNQEPNTAERIAPALSKYAHAVIFVVKANDPRLKDGKYKDTLQKLRQHFKKDGYAPVAVITYLDKLKENEDRDHLKDEAFDQASRATGAPSERTYFIANYINVDAEQSFEVDRTALDILDSALLSAESFIRGCKQREKNQMERKREAMAGAATKGVESVEQFFVRLQKKYNWTDQGKKKAVLEKLRKEEVKTVNSLKELWEDIKSELPLSMGMRIALEEEMKHI